MNDRELDMRVREAFDTLEVPDALRQRTLEAYDELAATQAADKPELRVVSPSSGAGPSRTPRKVRHARLMSALAACLVLGLAVIGIFRVGTAPVGSGDSTVPGAVLPDTAVTAFVDIDINPSIELQLNDSNQVVAVEGVNEDGRSVLARPRARRVALRGGALHTHVKRGTCALSKRRCVRAGEHRLR